MWKNNWCSLKVKSEIYFEVIDLELSKIASIFWFVIFFDKSKLNSNFCSSLFALSKLLPLVLLIFIQCKILIIFSCARLLVFSIFKTLQKAL